MNVTFSDDFHAASGQFHKITPYDPEKKEHFWVVLMAYQIDPTETLALLTKDSLVSLQKAFCYHCEREVDELIIRRPCEGRQLEKI